MAKPSKQQTEDVLLEVGKWTDGIVNARPGKDIPKTGLVDAVNVNISDAGTIVRRRGTKLEVGVATKGSSCFADEYGIYFKDGVVLKKATKKDGVWSVSTLKTGLNPIVPLFWTSAQGNTWYSNGIDRGKLIAGSHTEFSLEIPSGQPSATGSSSGGTLSAGRYAIAVSFISSSGEESGTQARIFVEVPASEKILDKNHMNPVVPASGKITVSNIPQPINSNIEYIRIYASDANGTAVYKYADYAVGTYVATVMGTKTKGMMLTTELTDQFPSCTMIHAWRGYMLGAQGNILWHSEPQRFGLCQLSENFIAFSAPITMIAPVDDGFYVVADKTWFFSGGTADKWSRVEVLPYGNAYPGSYAKHPYKVEVAWMCQKGQIVARNSGELENKTIGKIAPNSFSNAASMIRVEDGIEQIVNVFPDQGKENIAVASGYAEGKIIRANQS